ncbi:MAG: Uma2 family endonuclease [Bacillati bacterium ANGP1]|uniref:Uma2 family endonuclease n=1 Tax=Candidatus Segetimicrobium genomatis TaxID=2569760 RepID=A0A537J368_9BACT|nr:MAG: Uma2 family endonuclease [Terrabacteria group bacterium ANGP1]
MTLQSPDHALAVRAVEEALRRVFTHGYDIRVGMPLALGDESEPEPDVAVVRGHFRDYRTHPLTATLVVEVADTSLEFDRARNAARYASGEIPEYWIVNLVDRQVEVFRDAGASPAGDTAYQTRFAAAVGDIVAPLLHPERRIEVITLLP